MINAPALIDKNARPKKTKAALIGGGHGCKAILELVVEGKLSALNLDIICVVDPNPNSIGTLFAKKLGISTTSSMETALELKGLEVVIELTGDDNILSELYHYIPPGVKIIDHSFARIFWDLNEAEQSLRQQLLEKTKLEKKLKRDRKQLQDIINSIGDAVIVMDQDLTIEAVNAEFSKITGLNPAQVVGHKCEGILCDEAVSRNRGERPCPVKDTKRTGQSTRVIHSTTDENGKEAYFEVTANPIFNEDGELSRFVETFHRITEQVRLKRETQESERRFRQFIDSAHDLITIKDQEGRYLVINPSAAALFNKNPEGFIGKSDKELFDPGMAEMFFKKDQEVLQHHRYFCHEETLVLNGQEHHLNSVRFPLLDYKGDSIGSCCISRDVTNQKRLQRSLIHSEKLAALGKLAAGVAHEINTPLTGILTFIEELLIDTLPDNPLKKDYEVIQREALRCRRIVRDLLDYARMQKPVRHPQDINKLVQVVLNMVSKQADLRNIEFDTDLFSNLKKASIDSTQMQQVLLNLVMNAAESMEGKGLIRVATWHDDNVRKVFLAISDQGCGISPKNLKKIYEPFFSTKGAKGNGLGLPVVLSIVEQHGGSIDIKTAFGKGTTFQICLPACE